MKNKLAIAGFILSFLVPFVGLILSAIALKKCKEGYEQKGLAIAGVVISALYMVVGLIIMIALGGTIAALIGQIGNEFAAAML